MFVCPRQPSLFGLKQGPSLRILTDPWPMNGLKTPSFDAKNMTSNRDTDGSALGCAE